MYGKTLDSNASISNGNINCPIGKSFFAVNLPLKLFRSTVVNADTLNLKSLYTFFDMYLDHMLAKFELIIRSEFKQNKNKVKKKRVFRTSFDKALTEFARRFSVAETTVN